MTDLNVFFNQLTPVSSESWGKLSALFTPKVLKKGDCFISDGQTAKEIGFLESGIIRAYYRNNEGVEYNKHFFINPCFIGGYASLITGKPNQIIQEALTDCKIQVARYAEIQTLYETCPDIERGVRILAEQFFVQKEQREIEIVLLDADKRYQIFQKDFPKLEQQIPQYQIASYLGITPTQLSRIRKKTFWQIAFINLCKWIWFFRSATLSCKKTLQNEKTNFNAINCIIATRQCTNKKCYGTEIIHNLSVDECHIGLAYTNQR